MRTVQLNTSQQLIGGLMDEAIGAVMCAFDSHHRREPAWQRRSELSSAPVAAQKILHDNLAVMYKHWKAQPIENMYRHVFVQWVPIPLVEDNIERQAAGEAELSGLMLIMGVHLLTGSKQLLDVVWVDSIKSGGFGAVVTNLKERGLIGGIMAFFLPHDEHFQPADGEVLPESIILVAYASLKRLMLAAADPEDAYYLEREAKSICQAESESQAQTRWSAFEARWSKRYPEIIRVMLDHHASLLQYWQMSSRMTNMVMSFDVLAALNLQLARVLDHAVRGQVATIAPQALKGLVLLGYYARSPSWQAEVAGWNSMPEFSRSRPYKSS